MAASSNRKGKKARSRQSREDVPHHETQSFKIPYFAHQQLDPHQFASVLAVTLPVGKPRWAPAPKEIATVSNGGWEDDAEVPLDQDPDEDDLPVTPHSKSQKGHRSSTHDRNPYKRIRVAGGRPAVAKKVTADLDSEDEIIVRMKNAKYLEKDIAKRLADEGRIQYHPKTIGTRWARLRKVLAQRNDELLDEELTDWHDGDDDVLQDAYQEAYEITEKIKAEAETRKWRLVADRVKQKKPVTNFSQRACRERYESLQAGTAKPTPESVGNPDEATLARIRSRQKKEARIQADTQIGGVDLMFQQNLHGNAWTSKGRVAI